jgi:phospholipid/cholesterol/gamma-HCH transport system substrate-binding protein
MENKAHAMMAGIFVLVVAALLGGWPSADGDNTERHFYEMSTSETIPPSRRRRCVRGAPIGKVEDFDTRSRAMC